MVLPLFLFLLFLLLFFSLLIYLPLYLHSMKTISILSIFFREKSTIWNSHLTELVYLCFEIYAHVSPLVNTPSPEGNLPDDNEVICVNETDESVKAQLLLVFAWRSVKEISLFFGDVAWFTISFEKQFDLILPDLLGPMGDFFMELFIQAKHRGVFEQAYVGFRKLCEGFWK